MGSSVALRRRRRRGCPAAPRTSMTSRSKPRAMPDVGGMSGQRGQQRLVDRVDGLAAGGADRATPPRSGGAARPGRSARRRRWPARGRRRRARSARRRAGRRACGAPARPAAPASRRRTSGPTAASARLDAVEEHLEEDVVPGGRPRRRATPAARGLRRAAPPASSSPPSSTPAWRAHELAHGRARERAPRARARPDRARRPRAATRSSASQSSASASSGAPARYHSTIVNSVLVVRARLSAAPALADLDDARQPGRRPAASCGTRAR